MNFSKTIFSLASALLLSVFLTNTAQAVLQEPEAVPGEYIVKLRPMNRYMQVQSLSQQLGAYVKSTLSSPGLVVVKRAVMETQISAVAELSQNPLVEYAQPNYIYRINKTPTDPEFGNLWGLKNTAQIDAIGRLGKAGVDIDAERAWDITTGSKDVVIAVIDTGVDYNNPDLKDNIWTNLAELNGKAGVDDDGNGYVDDIHGYRFIQNDSSIDPMDDHGHGTHCSGTIGARANDGIGVVGVNWNVRIMPVKFLSAEGSGSDEGAIRAIDYAIKNGAKIMSNSWGGGAYSQALMEAVKRAHAAGIVFVAAAGNDGSDNDATPSYPASYDIPNVISVAAVENTGKLASFSNFGSKSVHVGAPGTSILSTTINGYQAWSGTSMAAPHVSGVAGLLLAHEPNLTNVQVKNRILKTTHLLPGLRNKSVSGGMVNAYFALTNQETDIDSWNSIAITNVQPAHPYDQGHQVYTVKIPGAKKFSLYFPLISLEPLHASLTIKDASGNVVDRYSDVFEDVYSPIINGDTATLELTADRPAYWGFEITKAAWK